MSASPVRSFIPATLRTALTALLLTIGIAHADVGQLTPVGRPLPAPVVPAAVPTASIAFTGDGAVGFDGNPHAVTATDSLGGTVAVTYDGSSTAPSAPGTYAVVATVIDGPDAGFTASTSLVIANAKMHLRQGGFAWGQSIYQTTPPPSDVDLVAVAAHTRLWLGLTRAGHVVAWQNPFNDYGEQDVPADLDNVVAITAGGTRAMAVRADGTLRGWGRNDYGQLDDHGVTDAAQVAMTSYATVVLHHNGSLSAWGYSTDKVLTQLPTASDFIAISGYSSFMLGLHSDGTVSAWGDDYYGWGVLAVPSGLTDVTAISAGYYTCLARKSNGTVVKWGLDPDDILMPDLSDPATAHAVAISMGEDHGVVLKDDGTLVEFGRFWTRPAGLNGQRISAVAAGFSVTVAAADPTLPTYDGTGHGVTDIITEPAGLDVQVTYDDFTAPALPLHAGSYGYTATVTTPGSTAAPLTGTLRVNQRPIEIDGDYIYLHVDDPLPAPLTFNADYSDLPLVAGDTYASAFTGELTIDPDNNALGYYEIARGTLASSDYHIDNFSSGALIRMADNTPPNVGQYGPQLLVRGEDDSTYLHVYYSDDDEDYFGQVITAAWSVQSGPDGGVVTFADPSYAYTSATASVDGEYVLRLTIDDGFVSVFADLSVTVVTPVELLFTDDMVIYDGSPHALTVTTNPTGYTVLPTFNGTTAAGVINAGTYSVFGSLSEPYTVTRGSSGTLTINKATTTLSFAADPVSLPFSGQPQVVTASADAIPPITGTVTVTYDGDSTAPSVVGTYVLEATLSDANYDAAPVSGNLEITPTTAATVRLVPRMVSQTSQSQPTVPPEAADLVQVIPTVDNFMALTHDGHVVTWGSNAPATVPAALDGGGVVAIANGLDYDLAVQSDGTLIAWGENPNNVLDVPTGTYTQVAALRSFDAEALALGTDGNVVAWGGSDITLPVEIASGGHVVAITAGSFHALALLDDGTVVGLGYAPVATPPGDLSGVTAISAGYQFSAALKNDGTVVTWGDPSYDVTVPADLSGVAAIAAGTYHVVALKSDGTVTGWGYGWYDAAPYGSLAGLPGVIAISGGDDITVALTTAPEPVVYDGTAHAFPPTIVTDPVGLAVVVTYDGSLTPPTHVGTHVVTVMADPNAGYNSALNVSGLQITPRPLDSLTVDTSHIHVGDALPAITGSAVGMVGSDTFDTLVKPFATHSAADSSLVGFYPIDISAAHLADYAVGLLDIGGLYVHEDNTAPELSTATDLFTATMGSPAVLGETYYDEDEYYFHQVVTATWTKVSGPGTASFATAGGSTAASFDRDGVYLLRYTVDDGYLPVFVDQRVLVSLPGTVVADDSSHDAIAWSFLGGNWQPSVYPGVGGSKMWFALPGTTAYARWTVFPPQDGWYELFYNHLNNLQPWAPFTGAVTHANGTSTVNYGGSRVPSGWVSLGIFPCNDDGLSLFVSNSGATGGYLRADAIRLIRLPGTLVDNGMTGYHEHGSGWSDSVLTNLGVTGNPTRFSRNWYATATWSDPGLVGEARVLLYRLANSSNDPEWLATLTGGDGYHHFTLDARNGAAGWADLGRHRFTGVAQLSVGHSSALVLRADAVRFALDTVVGAGDLGYGETGGTWANSVQPGHAGAGVRYSRNSASTATWRASLAPGAYRVSWYRVPLAVDSPVAKLQIDGATTPFNTTSDLRSGPAGWVPLGDFIFTNGVGQVQINRSTYSTTPLRVDAVRFEPLGDDAPVGVVPDGGSG